MYVYVETHSDPHLWLCVHIYVFVHVYKHRWSIWKAGSMNFLTKRNSILTVAPWILQELSLVSAVKKPLLFSEDFSNSHFKLVKSKQK